MSSKRPIAIITGGSSGIGAAYAERLAGRDYDIVLVARNRARMEALAARLRECTGSVIEILEADLTKAEDLAKVEDRIRATKDLDLLLNNAGATTNRGISESDIAALVDLIRLNVDAPTRLAAAAIPGFLGRGTGAIINIASMIALAPELPHGIYGATKAFIFALSRTLQTELGPRGIYVQAVIPGPVRTEIWARSGRSIDKLPAIMEVGDLVDAALMDFDNRVPISIPPLPDMAQWETYEAARRKMFPNLAQALPGSRYRSAD